MLSLYYATLYRGLFTRTPSFWVFAVLQVLHCSFEWIMYGFRSSRMYWDLYNAFREFLNKQGGPKCGRSLDAVMRPPGIDTPEASHMDLKRYVALEMGMRFASS